LYCLKWSVMKWCENKELSLGEEEGYLSTPPLLSTSPNPARFNSPAPESSLIHTLTHHPSTHSQPLNADLLRESRVPDPTSSVSQCAKWTSANVAPRYSSSLRGREPARNMALNSLPQRINQLLLMDHICTSTKFRHHVYAQLAEAHVWGKRKITCSFPHAVNGRRSLKHDIKLGPFVSIQFNLGFRG